MSEVMSCDDPSKLEEEMQRNGNHKVIHTPTQKIENDVM